MKTCGLWEKRDSREISGVANETFFSFSTGEIEKRNRRRGCVKRGRCVE